jgi:hypothetical protein
MTLLKTLYLGIPIDIQASRLYDTKQMPIAPLKRHINTFGKVIDIRLAARKPE